MKLFRKKSSAKVAHPYPWRLFAFYTVAGVAASLAILPYLLSIVSISGNTLPFSINQIVADQLVQSAIILLPAVGLGLFLAQRVNLRSPYLEPLLYGKKIPAGFGTSALLALGLGCLVTIVIAGVNASVYSSGLLMEMETASGIPFSARLLTALYAGIDEELMMRLFFMTLIAWIAWKIRKNEKGDVHVVGMWAAIAVSALFYAISHLPLTTVTEFTDVEGSRFFVSKELLLHGAAGIVYGWLYWKKGFESAMISHFASEATSQIVVPAVLLATLR